MESNIHLTPTNKPSRLFKNIKGNLGFNTEWNGIPFGRINQNIYITSDEEIKEGDWFHLDDAQIIAKYIASKPVNEAKKIILTTDQDLIKDGVQSIDDEFLQWFVKHQSCERVEVETTRKRNGYSSKHKKSYQIIIPQEEPKQEEYICLHPERRKNYYRDGCFKCWECGKIVVEHNNRAKQETVEEISMDYSQYNVQIKAAIQAAVKFGAKWQAERMCSESEVLNIIKARENYLNNTPKNSLYIPIKQWFSQFKKKKDGR
jgi:hypothetical protein